MTIVEFLRARLGDDAVAADLDSTARNGIESTAGPDVLALVDRVPAEVEAKRRIVELHWPERVWTGSAYEDGKCTTCLISQSDLYGSEYETAPCPTMRALALPYAGHPDYDERWRP